MQKTNLTNKVFNYSNRQKTKEITNKQCIKFASQNKHKQRFKMEWEYVEKS